MTDPLRLQRDVESPPDPAFTAAVLSRVRDARAQSVARSDRSRRWAWLVMAAAGIGLASWMPVDVEVAIPWDPTWLLEVGDLVMVGVALSVKRRMA